MFKIILFYIKKTYKNDKTKIKDDGCVWATLC